MEDTIITWNVTNWITIVLMAALGYLLLALVAQGFQRARSGAVSAPPYGGTPAGASVTVG